MKLKYKKFLYLLNDLSNMMLNKERVDYEAANKRLKAALVVLIVLFILSLIINMILAFNL